MTSLLVFGGYGQLGRELGDLAAAHNVHAKLLRRSQADVADAEAVMRAIMEDRPDVVVNAAAYTKVDDAEAHAEEAFRTNEHGAAAVARACASVNIPLIHVSTDYVFDGSKTGPYREEDRPAPLGVYGSSKAAGEAAVRRHCERHLILRTSWLYGVHGSNFLKTMLRLAREKDELRVVADQRGCPTGTRDLAQAILVAARHVSSQPRVSGTYHHAGTGVTTWHAFATEIVAAQAAYSGRQPPVRAIVTADLKTSAPRPMNSELDSSRFADTFGLRALHWQQRTRQVVDALLSKTSPVKS
jgi:dTDP-4-dehydrorhamnose reductase